MNTTSIDVRRVPQGEIIIAFSDAKLSTGLLRLNAHEALDKHNRPVTEQLVQVAGTCTMVLFEGEMDTSERVLNAGDSLKIPAHQYHIHSNPTGKESLTLWKFEGDITPVIQKIREKSEKRQ